MKLKELKTEQRNRATENLDTMTALELVQAMNHEDAQVPRAIKRVLPEIAKAVDIIAARLAEGGRLIGIALTRSYTHTNIYTYFPHNLTQALSRIH